MVSGTTTWLYFLAYNFIISTDVIVIGSDEESIFKPNLIHRNAHYTDDSSDLAKLDATSSSCPTFHYTDVASDFDKLVCIFPNLHL